MSDAECGVLEEFSGGCREEKMDSKFNCGTRKSANQYGASPRSWARKGSSLPNQSKHRQEDNNENASFPTSVLIATTRDDYSGEQSSLSSYPSRRRLPNNKMATQESVLLSLGFAPSTSTNRKRSNDAIQCKLENQENVDLRKNAASKQRAKTAITREEDCSRKKVTRPVTGLEIGNRAPQHSWTASSDNPIVVKDVLGQLNPRIYDTEKLSTGTTARERNLDVSVTHSKMTSLDVDSICKIFQGENDQCKVSAASFPSADQSTLTRRDRGQTEPPISNTTKKVVHRSRASTSTIERDIELTASPKNCCIPLPLQENKTLLNPNQEISVSNVASLNLLGKEISRQINLCELKKVAGEVEEDANNSCQNQNQNAQPPTFVSKRQGRRAPKSKSNHDTQQPVSRATTQPFNKDDEEPSVDIPIKDRVQDFENSIRSEPALNLRCVAPQRARSDIDIGIAPRRSLRTSKPTDRLTATWENKDHDAKRNRKPSVGVHGRSGQPNEAPPVPQQIESVVAPQKSSRSSGRIVCQPTTDDPRHSPCSASRRSRRKSKPIDRLTVSWEKEKRNSTDFSQDSGCDSSHCSSRRCKDVELPSSRWRKQVRFQKKSPRHLNKVPLQAENIFSPRSSSISAGNVRRGVIDTAEGPRRSRRTPKPPDLLTVSWEKEKRVTAESSGFESSPSASNNNNKDDESAPSRRQKQVKCQRPSLRDLNSVLLREVENTFSPPLSGARSVILQAPLANDTAEAPLRCRRKSKPIDHLTVDWDKGKRDSGGKGERSEISSCNDKEIVPLQQRNDYTHKVTSETDKQEGVKPNDSLGASSTTAPIPKLATITKHDAVPSYLVQGEISTSRSSCVSEDSWSREQLSLLWHAATNADPTLSNFWDCVASQIEGKDASQCRQRWFAIVQRPNARSQSKNGRIQDASLKTVCAHVSDVADDIFQSTPMLDASASAREAGRCTPQHVLFTQWPLEDFNSPIIRSPALRNCVDSSPAEETSLDFTRRQSPFLDRKGYKGYIKSLAKQRKVTAKKVSSRVQVNEKSCIPVRASMDYGDIEMSLRGPADSDSEELGIYPDMDEYDEDETELYG